LAAADYVYCFASLFAGARTPVFGHLSVGRSAFGAAVVAAWLNDPGITPLERVCRGLCEQLFSARELVGSIVTEHPGMSTSRAPLASRDDS